MQCQKYRKSNEGHDEGPQATYIWQITNQRDYELTHATYDTPYRRNTAINSNNPRSLGEKQRSSQYASVTLVNT